MTRVLILGGDSDFNLGDTAILHALCHCLAATEEQVEIVITSSRRRLTRLPEEVQVIPRGIRGSVQMLRAARASDLIVVGGGGLFQDDDSRAKMPYWAARISALKLLNDNIVGHCIGAGPLDHADSRRGARLACSMMRSISVRDEFARSALVSCTDRPVDVVPDPAFMLQSAPSTEAGEFLRSIGLTPGRPIIGVALRRWFHRRGGFVPHRIRSRAGLDRGDGAVEMERLVLQLATSLRTLAHRLNAAILLLPTYALSHEGDVAACRQLQAALGGRDARLALIDDPGLYKAVTGHLALMVSARMHPLIFAASMGVPIVGLAYNGKFEGLFDLLGVPRRLVWLNEFGSESQQLRLEELAIAAIEDKTNLRQRSSVLADAVYQRTAALLTESPTLGRNALVVPSAPHSLLNSAGTATNSDRTAQRPLEHPALLSRKLQRAVDDAWRFVPFYRAVWRRAGVDPQTFRLRENFHDLPIIGKAELQEFGVEERLDGRYRVRQRLSVESSSGSTGRPFDMYLDAASRRRRRWRFLRALLASGYRPGRRLMLISSQPTAVIEGRPSWLHRIGWVYADVSSSGAALLRAYLASRPHVVYGPLSSLLVLGQDLAADERITHRPDVVISTAEQVTSMQHQSLRRFFGTDVTDFYGMTELGLVAWRRPGDFHYRLEESGFLFEFLPAEGGAGLERLIVTDLCRSAMPWIRFDTGDLVRRDADRGGTSVHEFCGRSVDCLQLPGNRRLSPYRLIAALEEMSGIERFEVIQREDWSVDVNVWSPFVDVAPLLKRAESAVREVCGGLLPVRAHHRTDPLSASAGKLRPIQSYAQASK